MHHELTIQGQQFKMFVLNATMDGGKNIRAMLLDFSITAPGEQDTQHVGVPRRGSKEETLSVGRKAVFWGGNHRLGHYDEPARSGIP